MAYIGKQPTSGDFVLLDSITTSATASYTMQKNSVNFEPQSANHMIVSLNGTIQAPVSSFTVSGSTLTFASALTSSDVIDFILVLGNVNDVGTATTVVDSAITKNKLNLISESSSAGLTVKGDGSSENGTIQLNCSQNSHGVKISSPAHSAGQSYELILPTGNVTADKFLKVASVSGSGTTGIGQLSFADAGGGTNTPYFQASVTSNQSINHDTTTKANFDRADVDSASGYDTTNKRYTIPSGQGGYWHIGYSVAMDGGGEYIKSNYIYPKKNGSTDFPSFNSRHQGVASRRADSYPFRASTMTKSFIANLSASDYIEIHVNYGDTRGGGNSVNIGEYYSIFWGYKLVQ